MRRVIKSWMAVVAAALLLGTLVGVVWARPNDRPGAADITRKVTLAGTDFIPTADDWDYDHTYATVCCNTGSCYFSAPIVFPCLPTVTVERIKLHVADYNGTEYAEARLWRASPSTGSMVNWGGPRSPSGPSGGLQTYTSADINKVVWPSERAYIDLRINGPSIAVYGVTVEYHRNI